MRYRENVMKKLFSTLALAATLGFGLLSANVVFAEDAAPVITEVATDGMATPELTAPAATESE